MLTDAEVNRETTDRRRAQGFAVSLEERSASNLAGLRK
jgi:hypothetical protein